MDSILPCLEINRCKKIKKLKISNNKISTNWDTNTSCFGNSEEQKQKVVLIQKTHTHVWQMHNGLDHRGWGGHQKPHPHQPPPGWDITPPPNYHLIKIRNLLQNYIEQDPCRETAKFHKINITDIISEIKKSNKLYWLKRRERGKDTDTCPHTDKIWDVIHFLWR